MQVIPELFREEGKRPGEVSGEGEEMIVIVVPADELWRELADLRAALERIRLEGGRVCDDFGLCTHAGCQSSYHAWSVADAALNGETPESANERALRESRDA